MSSELKTNKVSPATGTAFTLGDSGNTFSLPSGGEIDIASGATLDVNGTLDVTGATVTGLSAGKVLQVLVGEDSTETTVATTTYTDVGLSQAITPTSSSSKILCIWTVQGHILSSEGWGTRLLRGTTNVFTTNTMYDIYDYGSGERTRGTYIHLDSPSTTSATTYKIQVATNGSVSIEFNEGGAQTQLILMEIGA